MKTLYLYAVEDDYRGIKYIIPKENLTEELFSEVNELLETQKYAWGIRDDNYVVYFKDDTDITKYVGYLRENYWDARDIWNSLCTDVLFTDAMHASQYFNDYREYVDAIIEKMNVVLVSFYCDGVPRLVMCKWL